MDLQERYDELDNIVMTLGRLADETTDKNYKDLFNGIKYEVENELEEIGNLLQEQYDREEKELEYQYERSQF